MCRRIVPKHTWCTCADPDNSETWLPGDGPRVSCPHHINIINLDKAGGHANQDDFVELLPGYEKRQITSILNQDPRVKPEWKHCSQYISLFTIGSSGFLTEGMERTCPQTMEQDLAKPKSYKEFYPWDGLCIECFRGGDKHIELNAVKLRHATQRDVISWDEEEVTLAVWPKGAPILVQGRHLHADGGLYGRLLDLDVVLAMDARPKACRELKVFVHLVTKLEGGRRVTDLQKSAVYFLPSETDEPLPPPPPPPQRRGLLSGALKAVGSVFGFGGR